MAKQQLCTCITLFCTFLCRRCTTTTWKCLISRFVEDVETIQRLASSFPELCSLLQFNSRKICQHLTNWTSWNKRDKVWSSANSLFKWRFRSRRRSYCWSSLMNLKIHSYFEKGCRKKCMRQSRKVLWVVLSSKFFKEIWKNGTRGHGRIFARAKGKQQKPSFDSHSAWNSVLIISHVTFRDRRVHTFADNLSRNSCIYKRGPTILVHSE